MATALFFAFSSLPVYAQTFPQFTGFVVDSANVIPDADEAALTAKLDAFQKATGRQLVVATVPDLQGYPIEDYGYKLGRAWAVGLKGMNNGALLIVAPSEHKVRIEVGYGLEGVLTDAFSSVVINGRIVPAFKAGDIPGGIAAGTDALIEQLSLPDTEAKAKLASAVAEYDRTHQAAGGSGGGVPFGLIFWGIVLLFVLMSHARRRGGSGRRYGGSNWPIVLWGLSNALGNSRRGGSGFGGGWGGGSSGGGGGWMGGGFGGGGGGSFGGGGASGSW